MKLSPFAENTIVFIDNPNTFSKKEKLLDQISEFSNVSGYNINLQK